jgi:hypothetical protein
MVSGRDEVSWARYETAWDWFKDLVETFGAKATYRPVYNAGAGNPYVSYTWSIAPIKARYGGPVAASIDKALEHPEFTETEDAVAKAEIRTDLFSEGNTTQWIINSGVVRADKQFTSQMFLHNLPVTMDNAIYSGGGDSSLADIRSIGLFQTNRIVYESGGQCFLAHPTLTIKESLSSSTLYTALDPNSGVDLGTEPPSIPFSDLAIDEYNLWVNAVQKYGGLPYAIGKHVTKMFGADNLATFEASFRTADYTDFTVPCGNAVPALGNVIDLSSSSAASDLPHFAWNTAVVTAVEADLQAGTSTIKFALVP